MRNSTNPSSVLPDAICASIRLLISLRAAQYISTALAEGSKIPMMNPMAASWYLMAGSNIRKRKFQNIFQLLVKSGGCSGKGRKIWHQTRHKPSSSITSGGKNGPASPPPRMISRTMVELMCEKLGRLMRKMVSTPCPTISLS